MFIRGCASETPWAMTYTCFGNNDPDVLCEIVGADLHVVRPVPDLVPLRPVFDHVAVAIEHHDDVLPTPINARPAGAPICGGFAPAGGGAGGFAQRYAGTYGGLDARPNLRKPGGFEPRRKHRQPAFLRHEHTVGTLRKNIRGLLPG